MRVVPQTADELAEELLAAMAESRQQELERGVSLVGPHRDELVLGWGAAGARLREPRRVVVVRAGAAAGVYELLRADGDEPVLILDDVFAELDTGRRAGWPSWSPPAEQVLITAAVPADVPELRARAVPTARSSGG